MLAGKIETNDMKPVTREELDFLLDPQVDELSDEYFFLMNWVGDEDKTSDPICFTRGILTQKG